MGIAYNPSTTLNGLVASFDAGNIKSAKGRATNILSWNDWVSGGTQTVTSTGAWPSYNANGDGNSRVVDTNPFGTSDVVWDVSNQDATSDADGGWDCTSFAIDPTKTYRFSTWMRRKTIGNGSSYLGVTGYNSSFSNIGVLNRTDGATNTNPYFRASNWWGNANDWYLVVGHVWPAGSGTGSVHADTGIYNTSGTKLTSFSVNDFVWQSNNVYANHRSYLYYSTDTTTNQQWYQPRVDVCDGSEPTIAELIGNVGNELYDLSGNNNHITLGTNIKYQNSSLVFASTQIGTLPNPLYYQNNLNQQWTISTWVNLTAGINNQILFNLNQGLYVATSWNSTTLLYVNTGADDYYTYGSQVIGSGWKYVTFRFNNKANYRTIYSNGVNVTTSGPNNTYTPSGMPATLTAFSGFNGSVSTLEVYNRVLTDAEVLQNFNTRKARYGL